MRRGNLHDITVKSLPEELVTRLAGDAAVRIERIVSRGHTTPDGQWYDQAEQEFVFVVAGRAKLELKPGGEFLLGPGDWMEIPAHLCHRVTWTDPEQDTVWLAVFYPSTGARP